MNPDILYRNIKNLKSWLIEKPKDEDYLRILEGYIKELIEFKISVLSAEFSKSTIKHDGENISYLNDETIVDNNIFYIDDEIVYVLTFEEFKDFEPDKVYYSLFKFNFEKHELSKDKQLIMFYA